MKRLLTIGAVALCVFGIACGNGDSGKTEADKDTQAATETAANQTGQESMVAEGHAEMTPSSGGEMEMLATGTEISLNGNMGCGHCNFQIGNSCAAAMKTADGHIVIFDNVPQESKMFENRMDGAEVTVAGVVTYDESGVAHMTLKDTPM